MGEYTNTALALESLANDVLDREEEGTAVVALSQRRLGGAAIERIAVSVDLDIERAQRGKLDTAGYHRLIARAKTGDSEAMTAIHTSVHSLIVRVTSKATPMFDESYRVQIGLLQVRKAVMEFDPSKLDGNFEAYLGQRVKWRMIDHLRKCLASEGMSRSNFRKIQEVIREAEEAGEDIGPRLHELVQENESLRTAVASVRDDGSLQSMSRSLDAMVEPENYEGENSKAVPVADHDVHEIVSRREEIEIARARLYDALGQLTAREEYILVHYYGLFDEEKLTMLEIGKKLGITESRVSQIYTRAEEKIKRLLSGGTLEPGEGRLKGRRKTEKAAQFLDRIDSSLQECEDLELSETEINMIIQSLPHWQYKIIKRGAVEYIILSIERPEVQSELEIEQYSTDRRQVVWVDTVLTIATKEVTGADLRLCLNLSREIFGDEYDGPDRYGLPQSSNPFPPELSPTERKVVRMLFLSNSEIAFELGCEVSTARTHVSNAKKALELSRKNEREPLIIRALTEGWLLEPENIPVGLTDGLSSREKEIIRDCYDMTYKEAAAKLCLSVATVRTHWHNIYKKMGKPDRRQVVVMAVLDGLIKTDSSSGEKDIEAIRSQNEEAQLRKKFANLFSDFQKNIFASLYKRNGVVATELHVSTAHVNNSIIEAARRIGLTGKYATLDLTIILAEAGLVSLELAPSGRTKELTGLEVKMLTQYYNVSRRKAAQLEDVMEGVVQTRWEGVFRKLGTSDRRQAVLMAIKDGLITIGTQESRDELRKAIDRANVPLAEVLDRFNSGELSTMSRLDLANSKIAELSGRSVSTIRSEISLIAQRLGLSGLYASASLAVEAVDAGILSLDRMPVGRVEKLDDEEKELLKDFYMIGNEQTAILKGVRIGKVDDLWVSIYQKLGTKDRRQAVLMATLDGLIKVKSKKGRRALNSLRSRLKTVHPNPDHHQNFEMSDLLSPFQKQVISMMDRPNSEIAVLLSREKGSIREAIKRAANYIGLSGNYIGIELAIKAVETGMLSLENIPPGKMKKLTADEKTVLKTCYLLGSEGGAKLRGVSSRKIEKTWGSIYHKLGVTDRRQVVLMALKDGLIVLPKNGTLDSEIS